MKKILIIFVVLLLGLATAWFGFLWLAMANAAAKTINANSEYWRQQLYLTQGKMMLDYKEISISSHYLMPAVIVSKPTLQFSTSDGSYTLSTDKLEFVSSFTKMGYFTLTLPEEITLQTQIKDINLSVASAPKIHTRSTMDTAKAAVDQITLDEFKLDDAADLTFTTKKGEISFRSPPYLVQKWAKTSYEVHPYVQYFTARVVTASGK